MILAATFSTMENITQEVCKRKYEKVGKYKNTFQIAVKPKNTNVYNIDTCRNSRRHCHRRRFRHASSHGQRRFRHCVTNDVTLERR